MAVTWYSIEAIWSDRALAVQPASRTRAALRRQVARQGNLDDPLVQLDFAARRAGRYARWTPRSTTGVPRLGNGNSAGGMEAA